jgi:hypothetical protein
MDLQDEFIRGITFDLRPWPTHFETTTQDLRSSFLSVYNAPLSTNYATHSIYNSGIGSKVVLIRSMSYLGMSTTSANRMAAIQGPLGTHLGSEVSMWAGERAPQGQHFYLDSATQITNDSFIGPGAVTNFYLSWLTCFRVLPPGWSFVVQSGSVAGTTSVMFWWEERQILDPSLGVINSRV